MKPLQKIILVDDHNVVRNALKDLIEKLGPFQIAEEFENGEQLLTYLKQNDVSDIDLILLDMELPGMKGDEVMTELNNAGIDIPVLIFTTFTSDEKLVQLFRLGVRGYLLKSATAGEMKTALYEIFEKGYHQNDNMIYALKTNVKTPAPSKRDLILQQLSQKEFDFLYHVCNEEELTYDQIAAAMKVHPRTIDNYRESIFQKFGIKSKTGLVLLALKNNLFEN